jgi:hypothetical protein
MKGDQVSKFRADTETVADMKACLRDRCDRYDPEIKLELSGKLMTRRERIGICSHIKTPVKPGRTIHSAKDQSCCWASLFEGLCGNGLAPDRGERTHPAA